MSESFDVVVAGGGPAGSTLAILVALRGHRVLQLEAEQFPRYKIGESLLPSTVHQFATLLGVREELARAGFPRKKGGTFRWGSEDEAWRFTFSDGGARPGRDHAYQVERSMFDSILLARARAVGVTVRERSKVRAVVRDGERIAGVKYEDAGGVVRTVCAKYVADASGWQTPIGAEIGERIWSDFFRNVAVHGYMYRQDPAERETEFDILCEAFDEGWMWYIPLSARLTSIGAVVDHSHGESLREARHDDLRTYLRRCPLVAKRLGSSTMIETGSCAKTGCVARSGCPSGKCQFAEIRTRKDYSYTHTRYWAPGMVLVGDAACFIDPVFSSGVHLAQYAALQAARAINASLSGRVDETAAFAEFDRRYRVEYDFFRDFLVAFYDVHRDASSYFWKARAVLGEEGAPSPAVSPKGFFVRLVGGQATLGREGAGAFGELSGSGAKLKQILTKETSFLSGSLEFMTERLRSTVLDGLRVPLFKDGLVQSRDGLSWEKPTRFGHFSRRLASRALAEIQPAAAFLADRLTHLRSRAGRKAQEKRQPPDSPEGDGHAGCKPRINADQ